MNLQQYSLTRLTRYKISLPRFVITLSREKETIFIAHIHFGSVFKLILFIDISIW